MKVKTLDAIEALFVENLNPFQVRLTAWDAMWEVPDQEPLPIGRCEDLCLRLTGPYEVLKKSLAALPPRSKQLPFAETSRVWPPVQVFCEEIEKAVEKEFPELPTDDRARIGKAVLASACQGSWMEFSSLTGQTLLRSAALEIVSAAGNQILNGGEPIPFTRESIKFVHEGYVEGRLKRWIDEFENAD